MNCESQEGWQHELPPDNLRVNLKDFSYRPRTFRTSGTFRAKLVGPENYRHDGAENNPIHLGGSLTGQFGRKPRTSEKIRGFDPYNLWLLLRRYLHITARVFELEEIMRGGGDALALH